jgi:hypothetical protein
MSLAKSIRAQERDAYDLAGYGASQISEVCSAAFSTPVDAPAPFRVTFIVGGGKKVRTGYGGPEGLVRETCSALEALSFTEDRSASLGQQGVFKYQHDTDKVCPAAAGKRCRALCAEAAGSDSSRRISLTTRLYWINVLRT